MTTINADTVLTEANTQNPIQDLLIEILATNQQILAELQKQTTNLANLAQALTPYGGHN